MKRGKWAEIEYDDEIIIVEPDSQERIMKRLKYKVTCNNFREVYSLYDDLFLPGIKTVKDAESLCHSYYTLDEIEANDVVALIFQIDFTNYRANSGSQKPNE